MKAAFEDGKTALREADRLKPNDVDIQIALGELYAATTNEPGETANYFKNALKLDDTHPAALFGFAGLLVEQNPPDARMALERALKTNPNYEPAHLLAAEMALDERRRPDAHTSIERALKVNPNSLEARSLDAAIAFLEGPHRGLRSQGQGDPDASADLWRGLPRHRRPCGPQLPLR